MLRSLCLACSAAAAAAFSSVAPRVMAHSASPSVQMTALDDLKTLAKEQNPVLGFYDPLNLVELDFWGQGQDATVGFLRHAEIKHGRVAMAAFLGYTIQANGIKFPWDQIAATVPEGLSPEAQWDAVPLAAKAQIILFIGFLEIYSEHSFILEKQGQKHYMKGGKPGYFPTFDSNWHPVPLNLYDPFSTFASMSEEKKVRRLNMEVNNGRLAMFGIMGYLAADKVPGSVPALTKAFSYTGDVMAPFSANFHFAF